MIELRMVEAECNVEDLNKNGILWAKTSGILNKYLGEVDSKWKEKISDLFLGTEDYTKFL